MYSDPLAMDKLIESAKNDLRSMNTTPSNHSNFEFWTKWMASQRNLFLKGKISPSEYFHRSKAFANFLKSTLGMSNKELDELISFKHCPHCLADLSEADINNKMCSNCRIRFSFHNEYQLPPRIGFYLALSFFWKVILYPKKVFYTLRFGFSNWFHVIFVYLISTGLLALISSTVVHKIDFVIEENRENWATIHNQIALDIMLGYAILNIIILLVFTIIVYVCTHGAIFKQSFSKTLQITSLILIPKIIILPFFILAYLLMTPEKIVLSSYYSIPTIEFLLLNLSELMGPFAYIIETFSNLAVLILLFYAFEQTWAFDSEATLYRIAPMAWLFVILIFGVPIYF